MVELKDGFEVQLLAKGSFIDSATGNDKAYLVETYTIRLNYVALNDWLLSQTSNCRECYETDGEWEAHKADYKARRETWNKRVVSALGIDPEAKGVNIAQVVSEVFTVVHIQELPVKKT